MQTINCKGTLIDLSIPRVMGIINVTPDSFYDGGQTTAETLIHQASTMLEDGATFLDIGGYSSRPDATHISEEDEIARVVPAIKAILSKFPKALLSIDTFRSNVAKAAIQEGAAMVNDISGGNMDDAMLATVAHFQVPYVAMHMRGTPQTMKTKTDYTNIIKEVTFSLATILNNARAAGINDIVLDPGFGFAKNVDQNFELLHELDFLKNLEVPLLIGISRKSMIYKTLNTTAQNALNGTTALHAIALYKGTSILRVHDVKEAMECVALHKKLMCTP